MICSGQEALLPMKLNYELPYNEWLHQLLVKKLNQHDLVIYERNKGCPRSPAPINEYIHCKSDIFLYHECHVESESVEALHVTIDGLRLDDDDVSVKDIKAGRDDVNSSAENKCFFNMCGEAAKLAASVLCKGRNITIYGIVVGAHNTVVKAQDKL